MKIEKVKTNKGRVYVHLEDGSRRLLFDFGEDKIPFKAKELIGMTTGEAIKFKYSKK